MALRCFHLMLLAHDVIGNCTTTQSYAWSRALVVIDIMDSSTLPSAAVVLLEEEGTHVMIG